MMSRDTGARIENFHPDTYMVAPFATTRNSTSVSDARAVRRATPLLPFTRRTDVIPAGKSPRHRVNGIERIGQRRLSHERQRNRFTDMQYANVL